MVFEICAAIATLVFAILVYFIIRTLREVQETLKTCRTTVANLETEIDLLKVDVNNLIVNSNQLVEKINDKVTDLDSLFHSISTVGKVINKATSSLEDHDFYFFEEEEEKSNWKDHVCDLVALASLGVKIFQQIKKRK